MLTTDPILGVEDYIKVVMSTRPVFYAPLQGGRMVEMVRGVYASTNVALTGPGPFPDFQSRGNSVASNQTIVFPHDASYHPGDVLSIGGWVTKTGAGQSPYLFSMGVNGDVAVTNTSDQFCLEKPATGRYFQITSETFATPYDKGWRHLIFTKNGSGASQTVFPYLTPVGARDIVLATGTYTNRTVTSGTGNPRMFQHTGTTNDWGGYACHWAVWNRVLTLAEIRLLYFAAKNLR